MATRKNPRGNYDGPTPGGMPNEGVPGSKSNPGPGTRKKPKLEAVGPKPGQDFGMDRNFGGMKSKPRTTRPGGHVGPGKDWKGTGPRPLAGKTRAKRSY